MEPNTYRDKIIQEIKQAGTMLPMLQDKQKDREALCDFYSKCIYNKLDLAKSHELAKESNLELHHALMAWTLKCILNDTDELPSDHFMAANMMSKDYLMKFRFYNKKVATFYCDCVKAKLTMLETKALGEARGIPMEEVVMGITFKRSMDKHINPWENSMQKIWNEKNIGNNNEWTAY